MGTVDQRLRSVAWRAYWPLRWFAHEFLWIAIRLDAASVLTSLCRVVGMVVMLAVARFALSKGLPPTPLPVVLQCGAVALVAILIGNLAKELAIDAWIRCVSRPTSCVREWTDRWGAVYQVVTAPRGARRN